MRRYFLRHLWSNPIEKDHVINHVWFFERNRHVRHDNKSYDKLHGRPYDLCLHDSLCDFWCISSDSQVKSCDRSHADFFHNMIWFIEWTFSVGLSYIENPEDGWNGDFLIPVWRTVCNWWSTRTCGYSGNQSPLRNGIGSLVPVAIRDSASGTIAMCIYR